VEFVLVDKAVGHHSGVMQDLGGASVFQDLAQAFVHSNRLDVEEKRFVSSVEVEPEYFPKTTNKLSFKGHPHHLAHFNGINLKIYKLKSRKKINV